MLSRRRAHRAATIVGYRAGGNEFAVSDPAYSGGGLAWLSASTVSSGVKPAATSPDVA